MQEKFFRNIFPTVGLMVSFETSLSLFQMKLEPKQNVRFGLFQFDIKRVSFNYFINKRPMETNQNKSKLKTNLIICPLVRFLIASFGVINYQKKFNLFVILVGLNPPFPLSSLSIFCIHVVKLRQQDEPKLQLQKICFVFFTFIVP